MAAVAKIVVIAGQTATGKTELALNIAEKYNGEIISADSRSVYRRTNIGTAKPTLEEQARIKHHLIDIIEPGEFFSASGFKKLAQNAVKDISSRGKLPIIAGGTGLYINSFLYDFKFGKQPDQKLRTELEAKGLIELQNMVEELGISDQINMKNRRYLTRAIENGGIVKTVKKIRGNSLFLGTKLDQELLKSRIRLRNEQMISSGLEKEIKALLMEYSWESPGLNSIGYKEWRQYFEGTENIDEVKKKLFRDNWQYARRQKIWFKRDPNIKWVTSLDEAIRHVDQFLIQLDQ